MFFAGFSYDAFVIFNKKDWQWAESELLPLLEKEHGFKCCVHYRDYDDYEVGSSFVDNVFNCVQNSRKVVAVISKSFLASAFCSHELHLTLSALIRKDNPPIFIRRGNVTIDKLPIPTEVRSFIDCSNEVERKKWVSELIKALESN